ncbi:MAG TPA: hypothetical protein VJC04_03985 [Candidatus Paceibacterota bacterium]
MNHNQKKCLCNEPLCAKCLGIGCEDDGCKKHSVADKIRSKQKILNSLLNKKKDGQGVAKFRSEIERLQDLRENS